MRLLLINPNTTQSVTDLVLTEARKVARAGTELGAVTGRFGARYIASRAAYAIAAHAALDAYATHGGDYDAIVLACFGDPGLDALKEVADVPAVGMAEAACRAAAAEGGRFAIVTGGARWGPMLTEYVARLGLTPQLAAIKTVAPSGAEIARDPAAADDLLVEACREAIMRDGAVRVVLGGAGLAGLAVRLQPRVPAPLVDSLAATIRHAEALAGAAAPQPAGGPRETPVESVGLAAPLARLLPP